MISNHRSVNQQESRCDVNCQKLQILSCVLGCFGFLLSMLLCIVHKITLISTWSHSWWRLL